MYFARLYTEKNVVPLPVTVKHVFMFAWARPLFRIMSTIQTVFLKLDFWLRTARCSVQGNWRGQGFDVQSSFIYTDMQYHLRDSDRMSYHFCNATSYFGHVESKLLDEQYES